MPNVTIVTPIHAGIEICFDLARDLDLHIRSQARAGERAVAGRTSGLIELGESVTWEARHFGIRQRLTSQITAFDRPRYFQDSMVRGAFKSFVHDHLFERRGDTTIMTDHLVFESPLGLLGRLFNAAILGDYMHRLLADRALVIKQEAERTQALTESSR